jgi:undecaprenyl-diphosphatase
VPTHARISRLRELDSSLLLLARTRGHSRAAERAIRAFSRTGEHAACWLALGLGGAALDPGADGERRRLWLRGVGTVAAAYASNYAVKIAVRRRRPELEGLPPLSPVVSSLSFPSAHSTTSFAAAVAYARVVPSLPVYGIAVAFALSRPYLGVHYPSDVLVGAALGTAIGAATR